MSPARGKPLSVLLVEGDTERVFYERVKAVYLDAACPATVDMIDGLFNVNRKVLDALTRRYTDRLMRAYCCLDRESRYARVPGLDLDLIRAELAGKGARNVLSVDAIVATQMIESWFFHDVEGIYRFLKAPRSQRNPRAFHPPEAFGVRHLKALFRRYGKAYSEGERARHFIERLNLRRIVDRCASLCTGIDLILTQARL